MSFERAICLAVASFGASLLLAYFLPKIKYKKSKVASPIHILILGALVSAGLIYYPIFLEIFKEEEMSEVQSGVLSLFYSMRHFVLDGQHEFVQKNTIELMEPFKAAYSLFSGFLSVYSPILTFGFVMSFFKNIEAYRKYAMGFFKEVFVFSSLNKNSVYLAEDLKKRGRLIVFTATEGLEQTELSENAKMLGAVCFKKDIASIKFGFHCPCKKVNFIMIDEQDEKNINGTLSLISRYKKRMETYIYIFSETAISSLLIENADWGRVNVRRIDRAQSLISRTLYETGYKNIFEHAEKTADKKITAVIAGVGGHGAEMLKTLCWFCQMDGYSIDIHAFDKRKGLKKEIELSCPELISMSGAVKDGDDMDACYSITFHEEVNIESQEFIDEILKIGKVTYVLLAQGNDERNVKTSLDVYRALLRKDILPKIQVIVYNSDLYKNLSQLKDSAIEFIGDLRTTYSEKVVFSSDLVQKALTRHKKWGDEQSFYKSEYNFRSSVASAIHAKMKLECKIAGADALPQDRKMQDREALRRLEHRRWSAYMRSQGYVYGEKKDKLLKSHPDLVRFDKLNEKEQAKDDD